ncbi:hypothetical protein KC622_02110, partial [Candidatus Dojkabacteria bacterium]|nr:hypothetical protein [Candidatus Dojkabacteria bacterium]
IIYLYKRGNKNVVEDVNSFAEFLSSRNLGRRVFVTELGNYGPSGPSHDWSVLANTISQLDSNQSIVGVLLFDSLGANKDGAFAYHQALWNDHNLIMSLLSGCGVGSFTIPQEGAVDVQVELSGYKPTAAGKPYSGPIGINGVNASSGGSSGGATGLTGTDPCLGNICTGTGYQTYEVAKGGLLGGNFEGEFVADGASELHVPKFWHVWYQNGCGSGSCGEYACSNTAEYCRRPEYKQSSGFGNRITQGSASAQWFTSFGTQHAGLYQQIDLGQGGSNKIKFEVKGSSWSDGPREENDPPIINTFKGRIGIDPEGGRLYNAPTVKWTDWKLLPNVGPGDGASFIDFSVELKTDSQLVTVFIATNNQYPYRNSDVYWDDARLYLNGVLAIGDAARSATEDSGEKETGEFNGGNDSEPQCREIDIKGNLAASNACWYSFPSNENIAELLCGSPTAYFEGLCVLTNNGDTSGLCSDKAVKCAQIPAMDGDLGAYCMAFFCDPTWDGDFNNIPCHTNEYGDSVGNCSGQRFGHAISKDVLGSQITGSSENTLLLPERGEYRISSEDFLFNESTVSNFSDSPAYIPVYQDINGNGEYDSGDIYTPSSADIKVTKVGDVMELELKPGLNILSMPLYTEDFDRAVELADEIFAQGGSATAIATYKNVGSQPGWNTYNIRGNQAYSDSFNIAPGDALYIVANKAVKLQMRGDPYKAPVQAYLKQGWNLIAIKGSDKSYTTQELLKAINEVSGLSATSVAVWDPEKGKFTTYATNNKGQSFGSNVDISSDSGIFVYIEKGIGYWTPSK